MDITEALHLAENLKQEHKLHDWTMVIKRTKVSFGTCYYCPKVIALSQYLVKLNEVEQVRNTILHEIAHALVGRGHNHDHVWRRQFIAMGGDGKRCYNSKNTNTPKPNFIGMCPNGHTSNRYRLTTRAYTMACAKCCNAYSDGKFDPTYRFTWKRVK